MKYCPYCGADFADGAASFCMECGKSLPIAEDGQKKPKEKPVKSQNRMEKKRKHPSPKPRKKHEKPVGEHMGGAFHPKDDGYDGYYDDVLPSDAGKLKEGPSVKVSTGSAQRKKGAQKRPCKRPFLQGQSVFNQS